MEVSIPLRKFRKRSLGGPERWEPEVSIPLRKFRKEPAQALCGKDIAVSIPLRKFRKEIMVTRGCLWTSSSSSWKTRRRSWNLEPKSWRYLSKRNCTTTRSPNFPSKHRRTPWKAIENIADNYGLCGLSTAHSSLWYWHCSSLWRFDSEKSSLSSKSFELFFTVDSAPQLVRTIKNPSHSAINKTMKNNLPPPRGLFCRSAQTCGRQTLR